MNLLSGIIYLDYTSPDIFVEIFYHYCNLIRRINPLLELKVQEIYVMSFKIANCFFKSNGKEIN